MPKLNLDQLIDRLVKRITQLENGKLLEARDINVLLTAEQRQMLKDSWLKQKNLRKIHKIPKTDKEKKDIGWKNIKEVRMDVLKQALTEAESGLLESYEKRLKELEIRQAKIYLNKYMTEIGKGVDKVSAAKRANNELTRNGLRRIDVAIVGRIGLNKRDTEIRNLEDALYTRFELELTNEEKEQLDLVREYEKSLMKRKKNLK
jgi:hypothetical protein